MPNLINWLQVQISDKFAENFIVLGILVHQPLTLCFGSFTLCGLGRPHVLIGYYQQLQAYNRVLFEVIKCGLYSPREWVTSWPLLLGYKVDVYILVLFSIWFSSFHIFHVGSYFLTFVILILVISFMEKKHTWLMDYTASSKNVFFF